MQYDVFISHATEDKNDVARPLADELERRGLRVWFDERSVTLGDSVRRIIDRGLSSSRFGVVIISPSFLTKEWPNRELDGLLARDDGSTKVILPVWHGVTREHIVRYSPTLADKVAVSTDFGIMYVADAIERAIGRGERGVVLTPPNDPLALLRAAVLAAASARELQRCRYEVEDCVRKHPDDVDARLLLDTILQALRYEEMAAPQRRGAGPSTPQIVSVGLGMLMLVLAALAVYRIGTQLRTRVIASPAGDRFSLNLGRRDVLQFSLTWRERDDVDLAVQPPDAPLIWYRAMSSRPSAALDRDVRVGPGTETVTIREPAAGVYRVIAHDYSGQVPVHFELSVVVNGKVRRVYAGKLTDQGQRYTLMMRVD